MPKKHGEKTVNRSPVADGGPAGLVGRKRRYHPSVGVTACFGSGSRNSSIRRKIFSLRLYIISFITVKRSRVGIKETCVVVVDGKRETLSMIWKVPDDLWERIHPIIRRMDPPKDEGAQAGFNRGESWTASYFGCAPADSGTGCPGNWETTAPSTGPSRAGLSLAFWRGTERRWSRNAKNWTAWTGNGSLRTMPGQGPFWGDSIGRIPTDLGKADSKRSVLVDGKGGPIECGGGRSQRSRHQTVSADLGKRCGGAA